MNKAMARPPSTATPPRARFAAEFVKSVGTPLGALVGVGVWEGNPTGVLVSTSVVESVTLDAALEIGVKVAEVKVEL